MKVLLVFCAALALTGCVHNYKLHSIQRTEPLTPSGSALIAIPGDGSFEKINYSGSGRQAARAVAASFSKRVQRVDIMPEPTAPDEQIAAARKGGFDYLVRPTISHWEDRATEWSGRPDRIEVELRTLRVTNETTLNLGSIEGRSRWGTLGGDSPEDMLADPLDAYVTWLFTPVGTPLPQITQQPKPAPHGKHSVR